jgi:hypothetical protein
MLETLKQTSISGDIEPPVAPDLMKLVQQDHDQITQDIEQQLQQQLAKLKQTQRR